MRTKSASALQEKSMSISCNIVLNVWLNRLQFLLAAWLGAIEGDGLTTAPVSSLLQPTELEQSIVRDESHADATDELIVFMSVVLNGVSV